MVLLQIAEPGESVKQPVERKVGIGIDLGTTNSLVAHYDGGELNVFKDAEGRALIPSVVNYSGEEPVVGFEAKAIDSGDTIASAKRFMGRARADVSDDGHIHFAGGDVLAFETSTGAKTPVEVSADILRVAKARAAGNFEKNIDGVVITVPAYFDDAQRQATRQAAELAGLKVLRLLNEPTAAAVAYGLDTDEEGVIAVYDLGGGTFDISILRLHRGVFEVLATGGDSALGGDDFDRLVADIIASRAAITEPSVAERRALLAAARKTKEALTDAQMVFVDARPFGGDSEVGVSRDEFEAAAAELVSRTLKACEQCLRDAKVEAVDRVVLVGGSTRMPLIHDAVAKTFNREPLCTIDPDLVVAMGAARQADILVGNRADDDVVLLDVTPLSLGLETYGGLVERIVPRNTTIPVARAQEFTTAKDGQTGLIVHVVQGERERVEDCRSLATFELTGIPPMVAGAARIMVTFRVDADGLLEVSAREETTGTEASVVVKPSFGLADDQVADMLRASYEFAAEDMAARQLAEARVEAEALVDGIVNALQADGDLLSEDEQKALVAQVEELIMIARGDDLDAIKDAIDKTGRASEAFAALRMDKSIQEALSGLSLNELEDLE